VFFALLKNAESFILLNFCSFIAENKRLFVVEIPALITEIANIHALIQPPAQRGSDPYTQYVSRLKRETAIISDQVVRRVFVACLRHLEVKRLGFAAQVGYFVNNLMFKWHIEQSQLAPNE
jgi:hypothetical protein